MQQHFIGTWQLKSWDYIVNGKVRQLWSACEGILVYTEDGMMSAHLMQPERPNFALPYLSKGSDAEIRAAVNGYVAYAGKFCVDTLSVYHEVEFSLLPNWIGTVLVRQYTFENNFQQLTLKTAKETISEKVIEQVLVWEKR